MMYERTPDIRNGINIVSIVFWIKTQAFLFEDKAND